MLVATSNGPPVLVGVFCASRGILAFLYTNWLLDSNPPMARVAAGKAGRCADYVANIRQELVRRRIDDSYVEDFWRALQ